MSSLAFLGPTEVAGTAATLAQRPLISVHAQTPASLGGVAQQSRLDDVAGESAALHGSAVVGAGLLIGGLGCRALVRRRQNASRHLKQRRTILAAGGDAASETLDTVVVGGGVSGLCAAFGIMKDNPKAKLVVTEARDRVGGNITTKTGNGRLWEEGPNSFQPGDPILATACDIGLKEDILLADPGSYRFVWWEGALRALPAGPADAVFGDFLSFPGKIRAGLGAIGLFRDPAPDKEETVKEFVSRNLGTEAFERLIDPFVSGVYAGDPGRLSAEAATGRVQVLEKNGGSLVAGALQLLQKNSADETPRDPRLPKVSGATVGSFREGLKMFPEALDKYLDKAGAKPKLNWKLDKLSWDAVKQEHVLDYSTPDGAKRLRSRSVVLTAPSHVAATLLRPLSEKTANALEEINYPRVGAVTVEYPKSAFRDPEHGKGPVNGFGQLHPRSQGIRTLGTIYSSSLFNNRVPSDDRVMLLHYIGGMRDKELFGGIDDLTEGELVEATHRDAIKTMLKPSAADELPMVHGVRVWPRAIPQLEVGHAGRLDTARAGLEEEGIKGVFLAGNYVGGVALGRCVEYGLEVAKEVVDFVKSPATSPEYADA